MIVIVSVAVFVCVVIVAALLGVALLLASPPSHGRDFKPPKACAELAAMFGATLPETFTPAEAKAALARLNVRMILVPEARRCRRAIEAEMKKQ